MSETTYLLTTTRGELSFFELEILFNDAVYEKKIPNKKYTFDDFEFLRIEGRPRDDEYYNVFAIFNDNGKLLKIVYKEVEEY